MKLSLLGLLFTPTLGFFKNETTSGSLSRNIRGALAAPENHRELNNEAKFCWKDSYGRGVGTIPDQCPPDRDKIGLLCYSKCPAGYYRWGFDCHPYCPDGFQDEGLMCRLGEYGRGAGYAAWDWDWCTNDHPKLGCEWCLAMIYPKCKAGYHPVGCNICRPNTFSCADHGMNCGQFDLSCTKCIIIGDPIPMSCGGCKQYDAGLCYDQCNTGYFGVGPVCWANAPEDWVNCGLGAASNDHECGEAIKDQVLAVGSMALFFASLGTSAAVTAPAKAATNWQKLKNLYNTAKTFYDPNLSQSMCAYGFAPGAESSVGTFHEVVAISHGDLELHGRTEALGFTSVSVTENGEFTYLSDYEGHIWYREEGGGFQEMPGLLSQLSVTGDGKVLYGVNELDQLFKMHNPPHGEWEAFNGHFRTQVSANYDGSIVWGVDASEHVIWHDGGTGAFTPAPGLKVHIAVSGDGRFVYGLNGAGMVFWSNMVLGDWQLMDGLKSTISTNYDGSIIWATNSGGDTWVRHNGRCGSWVKVPAPPMKYITVSSSGYYVLGITMDNKLMELRTIT